MLISKCLLKNQASQYILLSFLTLWTFPGTSSNVLKCRENTISLHWYSVSPSTPWFYLSYQRPEGKSSPDGNTTDRQDWQVCLNSSLFFNRCLCGANTGAYRPFCAHLLFSCGSDIAHSLYFFIDVSSNCL